MVTQTPDWQPERYADTKRGRKAAQAARFAGDHRAEHERRKELHKASWTVHPKPSACEKCQAMKGIRFQEQPQRPHPNCKCEIRRAAATVKDGKDTDAVVIKRGRLEGFEAHADLYFDGGQVITLAIKNMGAHLAGVHIIVDETREASTGLLRPGGSDTFRFDKFGELPVPWHVRMIVLGGDNTWFSYEIRSNA